MLVFSAVWSATELFNPGTPATLFPAGVKGTRPATRGRTEFERYYPTTANFRVSIVGPIATAPGTSTWLESYHTVTTHSVSGIVNSSPATRGTSIRLS